MAKKMQVRSVLARREDVKDGKPPRRWVLVVEDHPIGAEPYLTEAVLRRMMDPIESGVYVVSAKREVGRGCK